MNKIINDIISLGNNTVVGELPELLTNLSHNPWKNPAKEEPQDHQRILVCGPTGGIAIAFFSKDHGYHQRETVYNIDTPCTKITELVSIEGWMECPVPLSVLKWHMDIN